MGLTELSDDVLRQLRRTGEQLRKDLWDSNDLKTLALIAADLAGLNEKAAQPNADKQKCKEAAQRLLDHAALMALSKLNVSSNDVFAALKSFFFKLVAEWLPRALPMIAGLLKGL